MYFASVMLSLMTCDSPQLTTAHWAAARPRAGADTWTSTLPPMLAYTFCKSTTELDVLHLKQRMHSASAAGRAISRILPGACQSIVVILTRWRRHSKASEHTWEAPGFRDRVMCCPVCPRLARLICTSTGSGSDSSPSGSLPLPGTMAPICAQQTQLRSSVKSAHVYHSRLERGSTKVLLSVEQHLSWEHAGGAA